MSECLYTDCLLLELYTKTVECQNVYTKSVFLIKMVTFRVFIAKMFVHRDLESIPSTFISIPFIIRMLAYSVFMHNATPRTQFLITDLHFFAVWIVQKTCVSSLKHNEH